MSSPLVDPTFGNLYLGDTNDDDGPVIDSLVQEVDAPAVPVVEKINTPSLISPPRTTRILSGFYVWEQTRANNGEYSAFMIMPADSIRKQVRIDAVSWAATPGAGDYVWIVDESGKVNTSGGGRLRHNKGLTFDMHTGAIWAVCNSALTGAFELSWWATIS